MNRIYNAIRDIWDMTHYDFDRETESFPMGEETYQNPDEKGGEIK